MADYFQIRYTSKFNTTVDKYIQDSNNRVFGLTSQEFLKIKDNFGVSNNDKIYAAYTATMKAQYEQEFLNNSLFVIVPNTSLLLPTTNTNLENVVLVGDNQFLEQKDSLSFWADNYSSLINNDGYVKSDKLTLNGRNIDTKIINENCRVWIWIRSIDKIINISPFISNLNTSKDSGSGTFNVILDPIKDLDEVIFSGGNIINLFNVNNPDMTHVMDFFSKKIQNNDVIFIRFEKLNLENELDLDLDSLKDQFEINKSFLSGNRDDNFTRNWDMIGLIDSVQSSFSSLSNDKYINLSGRDLTKLITEDASHFNAIKFVENGDKQWIFGGNKNDSFLKRNNFYGYYDYYFAFSMKDIKGMTGFILNHLSNLGVVPDELFSSYGEKITTRKEVLSTDKNRDEEFIYDQKVKGIWQITKVYIDPLLNDRRIWDNSFANPDGTLFDFFKKICQDPFVEFWGDTNGDTFDFTIRQPPFTKSAIQDVVKRQLFIEIDSSDLYNYDLDFDERYFTSYRLQPENPLFAGAGNTMFGFIPIVYFNEIAEIWGNKRLQVVDNYCTMRATLGENGGKNFDLFSQNLIQDYMYVIETNHYLPFTRKGSITINGDRRIKRGSFVKLNSTNELFYVTSVSHSLSINKSKIERVTNLTVERGMVFEYVLGKNDINKSSRWNKESKKMEVKSDSINYFDIVDIELIKTTIVNNISAKSAETKYTPKKSTTKFGLNKEAFNFFLNREQFD